MIDKKKTDSKTERKCKEQRFSVHKKMLTDNTAGKCYSKPLLKIEKYDPVQDDIGSLYT